MIFTGYNGKNCGWLARSEQHNAMKSHSAVHLTLLTTQAQTHPDVQILDLLKLLIATNEQQI